MLDNLIGGYGHGHGHTDHGSSGYDFVDHKEFVSHEESGGGYFDRQGRYDQHMRLPANHGRPTMAHMPVCDEEEEDSDVEEFFESSRSQHTVSNNHNRHHQQPPPLNFMPPPPMGQPHHSGKMSNGWQGGHGIQHHGGHGMQHHGMQHHGMQHHGGHGMQHQDRLMAPQVPSHHGYINPMRGSGGRGAVVVKASENWRVSNSNGGHHKVGWGSKGL